MPDASIDDLDEIAGRALEEHARARVKERAPLLARHPLEREDDAHGIDRAPQPPTDQQAPDPIAAALEVALASWRCSADIGELRRALVRVLAELG